MNFTLIIIVFYKKVCYTINVGGNIMESNDKVIKNKILKEYVEGLFKILGKHLKQVILYGSYVRNEQNKNDEVSDIDIMILVDLPEKKIKEIEKIVTDYSYDLDLKYNILLSPFLENIDNYNSRIKYMKFYKNIEKEGVLLNV